MKAGSGPLEVRGFTPRPQSTLSRSVPVASFTESFAVEMGPTPSVTSDTAALEPRRTSSILPPRTTNRSPGRREKRDLPKSGSYSFSGRTKATKTRCEMTLDLTFHDQGLITGTVSKAGYGSKWDCEDVPIHGGWWKWHNKGSAKVHVLDNLREEYSGLYNGTDCVLSLQHFIPGRHEGFLTQPQVLQFALDVSESPLSIRQQRMQHYGSAPRVGYQGTVPSPRAPSRQVSLFNSPGCLKLQDSIHTGPFPSN